MKSYSAKSEVTNQDHLRYIYSQSQNTIMHNDLYPCLWYNGNAKEAADYYCSVFPASSIISENPMVVIFELREKKFMGLNGGVGQAFSQAISFVIECETQEEIDHYWEKLGAGGRYDKCGWLSDKFGMSWQIVPKILGELMSDAAKAPRVMQAFMKMSKFNIQALENA